MIGIWQRLDAGLSEIMEESICMEIWMLRFDCKGFCYLESWGRLYTHIALAY